MGNFVYIDLEFSCQIEDREVILFATPVDATVLRMQGIEPLLIDRLDWYRGITAG